MLDIQELLLSFEGDETVGASQGDIRFFHHVKRKERKIDKKKKEEMGDEGGGERVRALQSPRARALSRL
jgi:hypothetical protein